MIRLVHLLRRNANLSEEQFAAWLRDEHGPLVAFHQARTGIIRYVQTHRDASTLEMETGARQARGGMETPYDAACETWWRSPADLESVIASEPASSAYRDIIRHENEAIDQQASSAWLAYEYPQVATQVLRPVALTRSGVVRVMLPLRQHRTLSDADARHYWLTQHGPLVRSHAMARGAIAYSQVHRADLPLADTLRSLRESNAEPYLGYAEAWFDRSIARAGPESANATTAAVNDERNFIDWSRSTFMVGKELVFVDRTWV